MKKKPIKLTKSEQEWLEVFLKDGLERQSCEANDAADRIWTKLVNLGVLPEGKHDPISE